MTRRKRLEGRVALVTGGAQGIGLAYCRRMAEEGAAVLVADIADEAGAHAVAEIEGAGGRALYRRCDVTKKAEVDAAVDAAVQAFGRLDICIPNAGIVYDADFFDVTEEGFDRIMAVNVKGVFLTGQAAARKMVECGNGGSIVNIASTNAMLVQHGQVPYPVSKGAVVLLTKAMAVSLADHGIRVNAIAPGPTLTPMLEEVVKNRPGFYRNIELRTPLRRPGKPEEMAGIAAFLASDESSYMTGQVIYAEGGRLALNYMMPERAKG